MLLVLAADGLRDTDRARTDTAACLSARPRHAWGLRPPSPARSISGQSVIMLPAERACPCTDGALTSPTSVIDGCVCMCGFGEGDEGGAAAEKGHL